MAGFYRHSLLTTILIEARVIQVPSSYRSDIKLRRFTVSSALGTIIVKILNASNTTLIKALPINLNNTSVTIFQVIFLIYFRNYP